MGVKQHNIFFVFLYSNFLLPAVSTIADNSVTCGRVFSSTTRRNLARLRKHLRRCLLFSTLPATTAKQRTETQ